MFEHRKISLHLDMPDLETHVEIPFRHQGDVKVDPSGLISSLMEENRPENFHQVTHQPKPEHICEIHVPMKLDFRPSNTEQMD